MRKVKEFDGFKLVVGTLVFTALVITPWLNVDSLVIPKLVILFCSAMYLIPYIGINLKLVSSSNLFKVLYSLSLLILIQLILVMKNSESPIEQQIFGRSGRSFGLLSEISLLIFLLASALFIRIGNISLLGTGVLFISITTSIYSIIQSKGLDFFDWYTRTNGIIGTFGNPNFQSAFVAIAIAPTISLFFNSGIKSKILSICFFLIQIYTIYICQSTQGYIITVITIFSMAIMYCWYNHKNLFRILLLSFLGLMVLTFLGISNIGPFASVLFKNSIVSRFEFFRTAITTTKQNPVFGVGLDSFGDYSTIYKSAKDASGINEYTDSAHNYILNYAANGGIPLAFLFLLINFLAVVGFVKLIKVTRKFNLQIIGLFSMWLGFQAQSLISPATLPISLLGVVLTGSLVGLYTWSTPTALNFNQSYYYFKPISALLLLIGLVITYPYFNVDRLQLKSLNTNDGLLAIKVAQSYPESSLRYQRIGTKLLQSNLGKEALDIGRAATKFNPNSISAWGLILANSTAPTSERRYALAQLKRLDPYDKKIIEIEKLFNQEFPD